MEVPSIKNNKYSSFLFFIVILVYNISFYGVKMKLFMIFVLLFSSLFIMAETDVNKIIAPGQTEVKADTNASQHSKDVTVKKEDIKKVKIKGYKDKTDFGNCSKADVQKVIMKRINQIRYCYEKELVKTPELSGKIDVYFVISKTGRVSEAKIAKTTMKNKKVDKCIVRMIKRWKFKAPKNKGVCKITYPFIFDAK